MNVWYFILQPSQIPEIKFINISSEINLEDFMPLLQPTKFVVNWAFELVHPELMLHNQLEVEDNLEKPDELLPKNVSKLILLKRYFAWKNQSTVKQILS